MAGFGRLILCIDFSKFLCSRSNLLNLHQNVSKNTLNFIHDTAFPIKPKKPQTAFILYLNQVRQKFINETPGIKPSEIVKKASLKWAELDPAEKEDFRRQYSRNYENYIKELKRFEDSLTDEQKQLLKEREKSLKHDNKSANDKQKKEAFGRPKKPLNAFLTYISSKRNEKDPNIPYKDWLQSMSTNWKKMSNIEKEPYVIRCTDLMMQYKKDLAEWEEKMINLGHFDIVRQHTSMKSENIGEEK
ncbi:mitochondrial transcription factor A [Megachile rotundata]|uniref:mitochondrial transcription factor A n=1 Tax=Megachile rotundata TaxID=143995 RepID=UPI000614A9E1|nr:PREDICTED: transcription factor A, mitochondrial-like [Megachile rotundata]